MYEVSMRLFIKLSILSLLTSCLSHKSPSALESFFLYQDIRVMRPEKMNTKITKPLNAWILLFESSKRCFFYKTPFREKLGHLKLTEKKDKCSYDREALYENKKVEYLQFRVVSDNLDDLKIRVEINNVQTTYRLLNSQFKDEDKLSFLPKSYLRDVFVDRFENEKEKLGADEICHGVNSNCQDVIGYRCEKCPSAFYEVVDFNCPQGGSKYCGVDECGKKNKPACPRGYEILGTKLKSLCFDGSPAGLCGPGLQTFCNEDNILICL